MPLTLKHVEQRCLEEVKGGVRRVSSVTPVPRVFTAVGRTSG